MKTLSSIANQGTQAFLWGALNKVVNEKLDDDSDLTFGRNGAVNTHITRLDDGTYELNQHLDFNRGLYQGSDGMGHSLDDIGAEVQVKYRLDAEGKITDIKPQFRVSWLELQDSLDRNLSEDE